MRRTSRIFLNDLNSGKAETLQSFLANYRNALNYVIVRLWSDKDYNFDGELLKKDVTDKIRERFSVTARLAQAIGKQAKEVVNSQRKKNEKIPRFKATLACLDSRFVKIEKFDGSFEMCLNFESGVPAITVPFNLTKHTHKFSDAGWELSKSIRLGCRNNKLFVDLIYEKEKPKLRIDGKLIGIDRGYKSMLFTSNSQEIGTELKAKIEKVGKRRKSYHHYIETEENRLLKQLKLDGIKAVAIEALNGVKNRSKFGRRVNRLLSFWHYTKVGKRLAQLLEELGVQLLSKDPWKTSQRCPACSNIDKRNRKSKKFKCICCGFADDADHVGSLNLEFLGLAGTYSLRLLKSSSKVKCNVLP